MLILETRKCSHCGEVFIRTTGGFILKTSPSCCPQCGSRKSKVL